MQHFCVHQLERSIANVILGSLIINSHRADTRFATSQWEMSLQSNAVSHWLDANLESTLSCILQQRSLYLSNFYIIQRVCSLILRPYGDLFAFVLERPCSWIRFLLNTNNFLSFVSNITAAEDSVTPGQQQPLTEFSRNMSAPAPEG